MRWKSLTISLLIATALISSALTGCELMNQGGEDCPTLSVRSDGIEVTNPNEIDINVRITLRAFSWEEFDLRIVDRIDLDVPAQQSVTWQPTYTGDYQYLELRSDVPDVGTCRLFRVFIDPWCVVHAGREDATHIALTNESSSDLWARINIWGTAGTEVLDHIDLPAGQTTIVENDRFRGTTLVIIGVYDTNNRSVCMTLLGPE